jgi:hypothetical protein
VYRGGHAGGAGVAGVTRPDSAQVESNTPQRLPRRAPARTTIKFEAFPVERAPFYGIPR